MGAAWLLIALAAEPAVPVEPAKADEPAPPGEPEQSFRITPMQADLSLTTGFADRPLLAGAFFIGAAYGRAIPGRPKLFGAIGVEITYTAFGDPYRISMGGQLRLGLAWATRRGFQTDVSPDLLVYFRITPFGAGIVNETKTGPGMVMTSSRSFFGLRAGFGLTSIWAARLYFENVPFVDADGFWGEALKVALTVVLLPLVLLNHLEVGFEFADSRPALTGLLIRVGTGF